MTEVALSKLPSFAVAPDGTVNVPLTVSVPPLAVHPDSSVNVPLTVSDPALTDPWQVVSETYSDGQGFGTPKTRSSERVIPMSSALRRVLESHRTICTCREPEDLVFCTNKGTPLSPKNLYNRALAPTCDELGLPRVSWHSFRHASGTWIGEVGESVKTVQAILGHSDLETTLNIYMHAIPDSQRRAVERVAGVLFPDVPKLVASPPKPAD
jgi:integrase